MEPKPAHLGPRNGAQFEDDSVVAAYRLRPDYPPAVFDVLADLVVGEERAVLDVGCGRGDLTLSLAPRVSLIDAVDPSEGMIAAARERDGGDASNVRWIPAPIETAVLEGPYGLITAGQSLHWTDWDVSLPRLAGLLVPGAVVALVKRTFAATPWAEELGRIVRRYSTYEEYESFDLVEELEARGLFQLDRRVSVPGGLLRSPVDQHVESWHSGSGLSRDRMPRDAAASFDREVRALVRAHLGDGEVTYEYGATIEIGTPGAPSG